VSARETKLRVNGAVRAPEVRVITQDGEQLGVMPSKKALEYARSVGLDLVEISPNASPPVCKVIDYGKYRYDQSRKAREARAASKTQDTKEIKFGVRIGSGDLRTKCRHIQELLTAGHKVRVTVQMRGREISHPELAHATMDSVLEIVGDAGRLEADPKRTERSVAATLLPPR
jgi:translation initiation factor IF-3